MTASDDAAAIGWTAKPAAQTVTSAGMVAPSSVRTAVAPTLVTRACSWTVTPSRSKVPRRWRPARRREPVAELAAHGDRHVEALERLRDLAGRLDAGQPAADDHDAPAGRERAQPLAQPEGARPAGDLVGVLEDAGHAVVVARAAQGVDERVVVQVVGTREGDGLGVDVDGGDPRDAQGHAGAGQEVVQRAAAQGLSGRQLVHPDPFDEVRLGVDQRDLHVVAVQSAGQASGADAPAYPAPRMTMRCFMSRSLSWIGGAS